MTHSLCTGTGDTDLLMPQLFTFQNREIKSIRNNPLLRIRNSQDSPEKILTLSETLLECKTSHTTFQASSIVCSKFISTDINQSAIFPNMGFRNLSH